MLGRGDGEKEEEEEEGEEDEEEEEEEDTGPPKWLLLEQETEKEVVEASTNKWKQEWRDYKKTVGEGPSSIDMMLEHSVR